MKLLNNQIIDGLRRINIEEGLINRSVERYNNYDGVRKTCMVGFYLGVFLMVLGLLVLYFPLFIFGILVLGISLFILYLRQDVFLNVLQQKGYSKTVDFLTEYAAGKPVSLESFQTASTDQSQSATGQQESILSGVARKISEVKERLETKSESAQSAQNSSLGATEKYSAIRSRSEMLIEMMKKFPCSNGDAKQIKTNDEYDTQEGCKGPAVYVCHHCKTSLCSTHSYWIPDKEFPYFTFPAAKRPIEDKSAQLKIAATSQITIGFVVLVLAIIIGFIPFAQMVAPFIFMAAIPLLMKGYSLLYSSEYKPVITNPYPEFLDSYSTKWGNSIEKRYALLGNYTAVHCWNCLLKYHSEFIEISKNIFTMVFLDANTWKKSTELGFLDYTESDKIKAANFAANLYLNDFKFAGKVLVPQGNRLIPMERPVEYRVQLRDNAIGQFRWYMPTPLWLNEPNISKVEIDKDAVAERVKKTTMIISIVYLILGILGSVIGMLFYLPIGVAALIITLGGFAFGLWKAISATKNIDRSTPPDPNTIYRWYDCYRNFIKAKLNSV